MGIIGSRSLVVAAFALAAGILPLGLAAGRSEQPSAPEDAVTYATHCATCHGRDMAGGQFAPPLTGTSFAAKWAGKTEALAQFIRTKMPPASPGQLAESDYRLLTREIAGRNGGLPARTGASAAVTEVPAHIGDIPAPETTFHDERWRGAVAARTSRLNAISPVSDDMLRASPGADWLTWRGDLGARSYSPLAEIDTSNVAHLHTAWAWSLPTGANGVTPLVHDGVLFINAGSRIDALDASDGSLLWRYDRDLPEAYRGALFNKQRNLAVAGDLLFAATGDRHLIALSLRTGNVVWDSPVLGDGEPGIYLSAGPTVAGDTVIQPTALGPACRGGCAIVGFDRATGKEKWRIRTIAAKAGKNDAWNDIPDEARYGGSVWVGGSYDPALGLAYFGVGNSYFVGPVLATGRGRPTMLYTDTTLAIDPATGKVTWHHQHFSGDIWDQDEVFERMLLDLPVKGKLRQVLVTSGKLGIIDVLDRKTGEYISSHDLGLQNLVTKIDPKTGKRTVDASKVPVGDGQPRDVCPGASGARNWMTTAWLPAQQALVVPALEACMDYFWLPRHEHNPTPFGPSLSGIDIGWREKPRPGSDGLYGHLEAVDPVTGRNLWTRRQRAPLSGSLLSTGGGLVFSGDRARWLRALSAASGEELWRVRLNAVPSSNPITFQAGGRQYVAVVAGGGTQHDLMMRQFTPEIDDAAPGNTLWVFGL